MKGRIWDFWRLGTKREYLELSNQLANRLKHFRPFFFNTELRSAFRQSLQAIFLSPWILVSAKIVAASRSRVGPIFWGGGIKKAATEVHINGGRCCESLGVFFSTEHFFPKADKISSTCTLEFFSSQHARWNQRCDFAAHVRSDVVLDVKRSLHQRFLITYFNYQRGFVDLQIKRIFFQFFCNSFTATIAFFLQDIRVSHVTLDIDK